MHSRTLPRRSPFSLHPPALPRVRMGLAVLLLLASAGGCQWLQRGKPVALPSFVKAPDSFSFFAAPDYAARPPRRVLVLPADAQLQPVAVQRQFAEQLAVQLRAAQLFEVVTAPVPANCRCDMDSILRGQFDEYRLLELTRQYNADALMFTRVNGIRAYSPIELSVTVALVDRNEAIVLASADGNWSQQDPQTAESWRSWLQYHSGGIAPETLGAYQDSPAQFQSFVGWQIARRLGVPLGVDSTGHIQPVPVGKHGCPPP